MLDLTDFITTLHERARKLAADCPEARKYMEGLLPEAFVEREGKFPEYKRGMIFIGKRSFYAGQPYISTCYQDGDKPFCQALWHGGTWFPYEKAKESAARPMRSGTILLTVDDAGMITGSEVKED
jgi:hypothetical protein